MKTATSWKSILFYLISPEDTTLQENHTWYNNRRNAGGISATLGVCKVLFWMAAALLISYALTALNGV
jgi:hypothetical protein